MIDEFTEGWRRGAAMGLRAVIAMTENLGEPLSLDYLNEWADKYEAMNTEAAQ